MSTTLARYTANTQAAFGIAEAVELLQPYYPGLTANLLRRWTLDGTVTAVKRPGQKGRWLIARSVIARLIDQAKAAGIEPVHG